MKGPWLWASSPYPIVRRKAVAAAMFSTQTKMLILFLSEDNPLWRLTLVHPPSVGKIAAYLGVGLGTVENWKSGKNVNQDTVDTAFRNIFARIDDPPLTLKNRRSEKAEYLPEYLRRSRRREERAGENSSRKASTPYTSRSAAGLASRRTSPASMTWQLIP